MLQISVPKGEFWDEQKEEFLYTKPYTLRLEHSLISISKWESIWHVSFFETKMNPEQFSSYIKCMCLNSDVADEAFTRLGSREQLKILEYIRDPMTASTVKEPDKKGVSTEFMTSELVYYWMCHFNIPAEFEKWHINRLIMLIRICIAKEQPPKKLTQSELYAKQNAIKARNRAKRGKKG